MSAPERLEVGSPDYARIVAWLYDEAYHLDRGEFGQWIELMAEDLDYHMPVRQALLRSGGAGYEEEVGFFVENHSSLKTRVGRLATEQAWADQPMSRTRHLVTNVIAHRAEGGFAVTSAFLVTRLRSDLPYDLFTGERHDVLRETPKGLRLARRKILLDHTILKSNNLSMFF
jgi:3-phenylpropionate/cinnamic acid dioxygenase small subunit